MKPSRFMYAHPESVEQTLSFLAQRDQARILAGGQSLVPLLNLRMAATDALIDVNGLSELSFIAREGGILRIGAVTRHRHIEISKTAQLVLPLLSRAAAEIGHLAIRNRGTIGGSITHADPAAEWPLVAVTLAASLVLRAERSSRTVPARQFFLGPLTTAIQPDEMLCEIHFPIQTARTLWGFQELSRRPGDFAIAAVACQIALDEHGLCASAALGVAGAHSTPLLISEVDKVLKGSRGDDAALREAAEKAAAAVDPSSDLHGSAQYRRRLVNVLALRALKQAWSRP
jgi:CO/xanthine dehydrogenase FAD-binding subunit